MLVPKFVREFVRCKVLRPLLRLMRGGITPRRLAWSLALGMVIGINPSVGLTTLFVIMLAWVFGLNQIASQIGAHMVAPLHLLLLIPFIQLGVHIFHTRRLPLSRAQIEHLAHHPLRLFKSIWQWEWHALIVWGVIAAIALRCWLTISAAASWSSCAATGRSCTRALPRTRAVLLQV